MALVLLLVPLDLEVVLVPPVDFAESLRKISLFAFEIPALCLVAATAKGLIQRLRERLRSPLVLALIMILTSSLLSALAQPSLRTAHAVLRLLEALAIGYAVSSVARTAARQLVVPMAAMAVLQSSLAVVQVARGEVFGLYFIGEQPPLLELGDLVSAKGTFSHPYLLAGWAAVGAAACLAMAARACGPGPRVGAAVLVSVAAVPIGLTFSRMSLVGFALAVPVLAAAAKRSARIRLPLLSLLLGFGVPALIAFEGWYARGEQSLSGGGADVVSSGRLRLLTQAAELVRDSPLFGVGPGEYAPALRDAYDITRPSEILPVHHVPALIAAETGVAAGVASLVLLGLLAWRSSRSSLAWTAFALYLPFVLLDWPYGQPQGLPVLAAWVGLVLALSSRSTEKPTYGPATSPESAPCTS